MATATDLPEIPGYDVEEEIGRGGMGVVYRVRRRSTGKTFALKMILPGRGASFAELARFRIEAEAMACLNHPNIIKIRDVGVLAGYPFFAMEFASRGSLKDEVARGPSKPSRAAETVRTLATAMRHAHDRGMLHRDLKPANVLLMEDGTPIVTDFGLVKFANPVQEVSEMYRTFSWVSVLDHDLARVAREQGKRGPSRANASAESKEELLRATWEECAERTGVLDDPGRLEAVRAFLTQAQRSVSRPIPGLDGLTNAGAVMGSPSYMAPEQALGDTTRVDARTDIYALGVILYELLTGQPPFRSTSLVELLANTISAPPTPPTRLVPDISAAIEAICLKCLEKSPDRRYPRAEDLASDLSRFLDGYSPKALGSPERVAGLPTRPDETTLPPDGDTRTGVRVGARTWWPFGGRGTKTSGSGD